MVADRRLAVEDAARLTDAEVWMARHEELCNGRHRAIEGRLDTIESTLSRAQDGVERVRDSVTELTTAVRALTVIEKDPKPKESTDLGVIVYRAAVMVMLLAALSQPRAFIDAALNWISKR